MPNIDAHDIWNLEPIDNENDDCATPPEEQISYRCTTRHFWEDERLANRHHDCSWCKREICPSEYYYRIAIPMHNHVIVEISCSECHRP